MTKPTLFSIALTTLLLASCGDKMTDRHSEMGGGVQGDPKPGTKNLFTNGTPSNTDGTGAPMAGGKVNTVADTMWNQSSSAAGKPF